MPTNTASIRTPDRKRFTAWCESEKLKQSDAVMVLLNLASIVDRAKIDEARRMPLGKPRRQQKA